MTSYVYIAIKRGEGYEDVADELVAEFVLPHDQQAQRNHSQTLRRLAERGGLSACELAAVVEDRAWRPMHNGEAWKAIYRAYAAFMASSSTTAKDK